MQYMDTERKKQRGRERGREEKGGEKERVEGQRKRREKKISFTL